ncbi:MAG: HD domain-containing phosphohydrolase [Candidatus Coatesbacteria bacterium]
MPASNFLRGVTIRLIAIAAILFMLCASGVGLLISYHQHAINLDRETADLRATLKDLAPILTFPQVRRGLASSGEARKTPLAEARLLLQHQLPLMCHFSVVAAGRTPRTVYTFGDDAPELSADAFARALRGMYLDEVRSTSGSTLHLVADCPVPGESPSTRTVAVLRVGLTMPSFRQFVLLEIRRSAGWLLISFILVTVVTTALFVMMTRSLRSVASYAAAIEHGEFNLELDIKSQDEARTIAEAFNVVLHQLKHSYVSTLGTLAALLETKDRTTETHSLRGVRYAVELGRGAGLSPQELADLEYGALLHDIGKIGIADMILKKAGPLTEEEWTVMRQHPTIGYNVLRNLDFLQNALPVVLHHQERYDGRGYPNGLKGEQIPILARIFTIADSFDAMTSERPYRKAMRPEIAIQEVKRNAGTQFDPRLAEIFARIWAEGKIQDGSGAGLKPATA